MSWRETWRDAGIIVVVNLGLRGRGGLG